MPTLPDLQRAFTAALLGADDSVAAHVVADGISAAGRLAVYRHHVFTSLTAVLEATYPVVCRLVDRRFFAYAAHEFVVRHPPAGPCLFEYGAGLPEFLEAFPPCAHLGYLPDVARLEWAINVVLHAPEATALDAATLRRLPPDGVTALPVTLPPCIALVRSPWPIDAIWRANQPEADPDARVDLDAGGAMLEVRRAGDDVRLRSLSAGSFACRQALARGEGLAVAAEHALVADGAFDVAAELRALLDEDALVAGPPPRALGC